MSGQFGRIKNDFSRAEAYAKQAAIREVHYVETLHWKKALAIFFIGIFLGFAVSNFAHASGMTANANYNPAHVTITGGTISASTINAATSQSLNGNLIMSATAPTILTGFGTGASISQANGTAAFTINVGTGGTASSGTLIMPAAPTGWVCFFVGEYPGGQINEETRHAPGASGSPTTDVPVYNELVSTGVVSAWPSGTILYGACTAH